MIGIVCEYNPFHNGHLHHINEALRLTDADLLIACMSGNFNQRGDISIINKYEKTKAYYFTKSKNEKNEEFFQFNNKNEEKDEECINKMKELMEINYENRIQEIFDEINKAFNIFGNYEKAYDVDFQNDIKIKLEIFWIKLF